MINRAAISAAVTMGFTVQAARIKANPNAREAGILQPAKEINSAKGLAFHLVPVNLSSAHGKAGWHSPKDRQRLIPAKAFWIPVVAQGPHGMVKNLKPFSTKKFGSMPGGMKYMPAVMPCFAAVAAILSSAR